MFSFLKILYKQIDLTRKYRYFDRGINKYSDEEKQKEKLHKTHRIRKTKEK